MKNNLFKKLLVCSTFTLGSFIGFSSINKSNINEVKADSPVIHNTVVTDCQKNVYDGTWFRFTLDGYPTGTFNDTTKQFSTSAYSSFNFLDNIYINEDETQNFFISGLTSVIITYNIQGENAIAFHTSQMSASINDIKSVGIKKGTKFPYLKADISGPLENEMYVTTEDVVLYDAGNNKYQKKDDVDSPITFVDYGGDLSTFNGEWCTAEETKRSSFNLTTLPNRTLDIAFDWIASGSKGEDSIKIRTSSSDSKDSGVWFYKDTNNNLHYAEVHCNPSGDQKIKTNVSSTDVTRIHYIRKYNETFTTFNAYLYVDEYKADNFGKEWTLKTNKVDTSGDNSLFISNIKAGGAIRSAFKNNLASTNYTVTLSYNGSTLPITVLGGTTIKTVLARQDVKDFLVGVTTPIITNDLNVTLYSNSIIHRDITLKVTNDTRPIANFTKINEYNNNVNITDKPDYVRTYLEFDKKPTATSKQGNISHDAAFINGESLNNYSLFEMTCRDAGGNFVLIDLPKSALVPTDEYPYVIYTQDAGISAYDVVLGGVNLVLNKEGKWEPCGVIHKVEVNTQTMYIPHGYTLPEKDLSKYCSATFKDEGGNPIDITAPITKDMKIIATYIEHDLEHHEAKERSCTEQGNLEYWICKNEGCHKVFIKDAKGNYVLSSLEEVIFPAHHNEESINKVPGKKASCSVNGYKDAWYCNDCENFYSDQNMSVLIGNETAYEAWKLNEGKLTNGEHHMIKTNEVKSTCSTYGHKAYWYCDECEYYYADENGATLIGKEADLALWFLDTDKGLLPLDNTNHVHGLTHHASEASTCNKQGRVEYWQCEDCKTCFTDEEGKNPISLEQTKLPIDPNGHDLTFVKEVSATYEKEGTKAHYFCENCAKLFIKDTSGNFVEITPDQLVIAKLKKGCNGNIASLTIIPSVLALSSLMVLLIKKRKKSY